MRLPVAISSSLDDDARNTNTESAVVSNSIEAGCVEGAVSGHSDSVVEATAPALPARMNSVPIPICSSQLAIATGVRCRAQS